MDLGARLPPFKERFRNKGPGIYNPVRFLQKPPALNRNQLRVAGTRSNKMDGMLHLFDHTLTTKTGFSASNRKLSEIAVERLTCNWVILISKGFPPQNDLAASNVS